MIANFSGQRAAPTNHRAERLWLALRATIEAETDVDRAIARVPSYTGQWSDADYFSEELDAFNRAKERFYEVVVEVCTDAGVTDGMDG